jgi:hypothetical protein
VGAFLCYAIAEQPAGSLVVSAAALGAVLAFALRKALFPRI